MRVLPFVHEGLGNSSYLVEVGPGHGVLVDPDRSVARYLAAAEEMGLQIQEVFETHLHADFVTGSVEVRAATGATILLPAAGSVAFAHRGLVAGERFPVGEVEVEAIAPPDIRQSTSHTFFAATGLRWCSAVAR